MKNLKNIGKVLGKNEQLSVKGGGPVPVPRPPSSGRGYACMFAGICFNALNEYHCLVQMGLQPCA